MLQLDAEALYAELREGVRGLLKPEGALVGVWSGGAWLAERLQQDLGLPGGDKGHGVISSTLHRDDFSERGLASGTDATRLPFSIDGRHIVLIDDVLYTGRTLRAVINELFDFGRPASVTLAVLVDNEPGVLARVTGLFSGRGYNIDSLTVAEVDASQHRSRITIVTQGTPHILEQIEAQLLRLVPVAEVIDITNSKTGIERELALVKVAGTGEKRVEALRIAEIFRAHVIDTTNESFIFEVTGASEKLTQFVDLMRPLGLVEVSRTGVLSIKRGKEKG